MVIEDNCIGSGCELCINVCPFDALRAGLTATKVGDFFGAAKVIERRCTGCRLCEQSCGWAAIYIDPPRRCKRSACGRTPPRAPKRRRRQTRSPAISHQLLAISQSPEQFGLSSYPRRGLCRTSMR